MNSVQQSGLQADAFLRAGDPSSLGGSNLNDAPQATVKMGLSHQVKATHAHASRYYVDPACFIEAKVAASWAIAASMRGAANDVQAYNARKHIQPHLKMLLPTSLLWGDIPAIPAQQESSAPSPRLVAPLWKDAAASRSTVPSSTVVDDIVSLFPGWDGEGSVAPTSEAKRVAISVAAYLASYLSSAEVEVDPTDGGISLRWISRTSRSLVSVDIRPSGRVIVAGTSSEGESSRASLSAAELQRLPRAVLDAGLSNIDDRLR